jgi:hypothetical protein
MVAFNIRCVSGTVALAAAVLAASPVFAQSADLRHVRNGGRTAPVSPGEWVNGSLNATQAHYLEAYSVPYRVLITGLSTGAGNPHSLVVEWDITKGGKHALDFVTSYNRIEPHAPAFGHPAEVIDPLLGLPAGTYTLSPNVPADILPAPSSAGSPVAGEPTAAFNALPLAERRLTIYNGTITGLSYVDEDSHASSDGSASLKIDFIANTSTVVILWGGHIAASETWGQGNSAAQIPGASYHTRLISLDGASTGNQDRSLSAQAVFIPEPPDCDIDGPDLICPGSTNPYSANANPEATYLWTITSACGATFGDGTTTATTQNVQVIACATCGTYTLNLAVTADNLTTECSRQFSVSDTIDPSISGSIAATNSQCFGNLPAAATNITQLLALMNPGATITDNCTLTANLTVGSSDGGLTGSQCDGSRVRTYTVTDACGNSANVTHTFNFDDTIAPTINGTIAPTSLQCNTGLPAPATTLAQLLALMNSGATIIDNCAGSLGVTSSDGALTGTACNGSRTRTYTVQDACGNTATVNHVFNIQDTIGPSITGAIAPTSLQCNQLPAPATTIAQLLALMGGGSITDNCPGSLTLQSSDGALSGTACNGSRVRTYTIKDACNNAGTITHTFNIQDTTAPVINGTIASTPVECDGGGLPAAATTIGQLLALMNQGAVIADNCTATNSLTVSHIDNPIQGSGCDGTRTRTYTVKDACNNPATVNHVFTFSDEEDPIISAPPNANVECGNAFPVKANTLAALQAQGGDASDDCALESVQWVSDEQISPGAECPVTYRRTYRATDACGNTSLSDQLIVLQDSTPPIICCTAALLEGCLEFPVILQVPIVTDECGMTITPIPVRSDGKSINEPYDLGDTTVTWTAHDGCGNKAEPLVITVRIRDCPVFTTLTQNQWANHASSDGSLVQTLLTSTYGGPLIVGRNGGDAPRSFSVGQASAPCLATRLPASGTAATLPANFGNKSLNSATCQTSNPSLPLTSAGKFKNVLIGNTIGLMLNSRYNKFLSGTTEFNALQLCPVMTTIDGNGVVKSYVIPASVLSRLGANPTVAKLRDLGRDALAGISMAPATLGNVNTAIQRVNQMFNSNLGSVALLSTSCASTPKSTFDPLLFGQDGVVNGAGTDILPGGSTPGINTQRTPSANAVVNSGTFAPAQSGGMMKIDGDYVQEVNASLIIELRSEEPTTGYDTVMVDGNAFLHGLLMVNLAEGYTPKTGDQFPILSAQSINGEFDAVQLADVPGLPYLALEYTQTAVIVDVRTTAITGDIDQNGSVDAADLLSLVNQWNAANSPADLNGDGTVNASDLVMLLGNWGANSQSSIQ